MKYFLKDRRFAAAFTFLFIFASQLCHASGKKPADKSSPKAINTVAILPFHCRAGAEHKNLTTAISLIVGNVIQQSGHAAIVDRKQIEKVLGEKHLAEAALTDKAELAKKGQMIGADYIVTGHYDVIDGKLIIDAELLSSRRKLDLGGKLMPDVKRGFSQISHESDILDSIGVIERLASSLRDALPVAKAQPATRKTGIEANPNKAMAVFDFVGVPDDKHTQNVAMALTARINIDLQEVLPLQIVERERIRAVLREKNLALAGLTQSARTLRAAKLIGANYVLVGSVLHYGKSARLDMQVLDVATGAIVTTASGSGKYDDLLAMHRKLAVTVAERLGAGLQRLDWLRKRKIGKPEAVTHAWIALSIVTLGCRVDDEDATGKMRSSIKLALELDPENPLVLYVAGIIEDFFGNRKRAENYLRKAAELDSGSWFLNDMLAQFILKRRNDSKEALPYAQRAVQISPRGQIPNLNLARCLVGLKRFKEAEPHARLSATIHGGRVSARRLLAEILEKLGRYSESADWYRKTARAEDSRLYNDALSKARELYKKAGETDKAMAVLRTLVARGGGQSGDVMELAEYLSNRKPTTAASLCYMLIAEGEKPYSRQAATLLKKMGMPPELPLITGPVFDIAKLRDKGIRLYLQKYRGLKYQDKLPYIKTYLEDCLGVPVVISEDARPLVAVNYIRSIDKIKVDDFWWRELMRIAANTKSTAAVGMVSVEKVRAFSHRWLRGKHGAGLITTHFFEPRLRSTKAPSWQVTPFVIREFQRALLKTAALSLMPPGRPRAHQCSGKRCALSAFSGALWMKDAFVCKDCRKMLQEKRKDWPAGQRYRPPIQAGPAKPAAEIKRKVLLVPMGLSAKEANLEAVAKCIRMSLGMEVEISSEVEILETKRSRGWSGIASIMQYASKLKLDGRTPAAVCVLTNDKTWEPRTALPWHIWIPGQYDVPADVKCPVIVITTARMPNRFQRNETVSLIVDGKTETCQVPQYGKLMVGALAIAATKDHQCWTYGCPATAWQLTGIPHRCSYWLCPQCRKAVGEYYKQDKATPQPVESQGQGERK